MDSHIHNGMASGKSGHEKRAKEMQPRVTVAHPKMDAKINQWMPDDNPKNGLIARVYPPRTNEWLRPFHDDSDRWQRGQS